MKRHFLAALAAAGLMTWAPWTSAAIRTSVSVVNTNVASSASAELTYTEDDGTTATVGPVVCSAGEAAWVRNFAALTRIPDGYQVDPESIVVEGFENENHFLYRATVVWGGDLAPGAKGTVTFDAKPP